MICLKPVYLQDRLVLTVAENTVCSPGDLVALTKQEVDSLDPPISWTAADGLSVGWSIAGVWITVAVLMWFAKIVKSGSENNADQP